MARPKMRNDDTQDSDPRASRPSRAESGTRSLMIQGWAGIAFWMAFGLLLEGLLGYKSPSYLFDQQRRELFRLAHSHGVLLNLLLIVLALCGRHFAPPRIATRSLRAGAVLMPVGFLLAGIWHPEGDPGLGIWLVPPGALMLIFGTVLTAISWKKSRDQIGS